ncbi:MAG: S41 family peptidase [Muribaculaceae bacterium]|nr:S41 family peptidase [Muribaculaceae bacterium]
MMKYMKKSVLTVLTAIILMPASALADTRSSKSEISRNLDIFAAIYKALQTNYVDSIDADKSMKTAIDAMLMDIDPYTEYYPEEDQEEFTSVASGEYGGIGSYIVKRPGQPVTVSQPREGSPAALAGLKPGDRFVMIDNDTVTGWTSEQVSNKLKGQAGTVVRITVNRPYVEDSILTFDVTRRKIQIETVPYYGVVKDNIGYIQLSTFNEKSAEMVKDALIELTANPAVKSIVLDLRGNGGGLLESAVQIVGLFVPKGTEVLKTRGKGLLNEKTYKTTSAPVAPDIPLAVLVNGNSASSAEIVTGAVQDLDRGVVVGTRSFGKGLVQGSRPLPYNGILKVTTAKYYIPSGRCIQAIDYSHRNPDGSVARMPDSLTTVFHTASGREVRDGGGITPDSVVTQPDINRLVFNVVNGGWDFEFATKYASEHAAIAAPEEFEVTDEIYEQFKNFIDPKKFEYDKYCELVIEELEKAANREGYMNDSVRAGIDALKPLLKHNLNHDLDTHRDQIAPFLASEILHRYYYDRGAIIEGLRHDLDLDAAAAILNDPKLYKEMLEP